MSSSVLQAIRIVLVEPAGSLNVGSVARVMKNMGLSYLVLVNPDCDHLGTEARQMAVHAVDVLERSRVVTTLPDGLRGCRRAIAATGRPWSPTITLEDPRDALPWLLEPAAESDSMALIFGPEDRGLSNEELNYAHRFVYIPSNPNYPSLNLAQAVGICCYELYQCGRKQEVGTRSQESEARKSCRKDKQGKGNEEDKELGSQRVQERTTLSPSCSSTPSTSSSSTSPFPIPYSPSPISYLPSLPSAPLDELEEFYQRLEVLLLEVGYLYPHTVSSRMRKFRRLFNRAMPTSEEVAMLRGVLRQVGWALKQGKQR